MSSVCQNSTAETISINLPPVNLWAPYQFLFDSTDISALDIYAIRSTNNFDNPFERYLALTYEQEGTFGVVTRDIVRGGEKGIDDKGRISVEFVSHAGLPTERRAFAYAPQKGLYVPTKDGLFWPGTTIPFETLEFREVSEARKRLAFNEIFFLQKHLC